MADETVIMGADGAGSAGGDKGAKSTEATATAGTAGTAGAAATQAPEAARAATEVAKPATPHVSGAWYDGIPADVLSEKVKQFKDVGELVKSYTGLEKVVGRKGVLLPTAESKPEEVAEFRKALGVPEKPEGYDWKPGEGAGVTLDDRAMGEVRTALHKANLSKDQFRAVMEHYTAREAQLTKAAQDELVAESVSTVEKLKSEWGAEYERKLDRVRQVAKATGLGEVFKNAGMGNSYLAATALHKIAQYLPESEAAGGKTANGDGLRAELETIGRSPAMKDKLHPAHEQLMKRREEIYRTLYPGR